MTKQENLQDTQMTPAHPGWLPKVTIEHLWLGLPIALTASFGFLLKLRLVDFWWHLKAGEIIVTTRSLPQTDLFSYTCAGKQFVLQNWLVEALYYLMYRAGGLELLVFVNALLLVLALLPIYHLCRLSTASLRLSVLISLLPAVLLLYFGSVRSQVFSFILFGVFYWVLSAYRNRRRDLLWSMPVLMALWVNLHGGFVLGLGLIGLVLVCEAVRRVINGPISTVLSVGEIGRLGLFFVVTTLASLANPWGYKIYTYARSVAGTPYSRSQVLEWQVPVVNDLEGFILFYGPFFLTLLVLVYAKLKPDLTELALFLAFTIFALMAVRNAVWFVLISAPLLARYLPAVDYSGFLEPLRRFRHIDALVRWVASRKGIAAPIRYRLNRQIAVLMLTIIVMVSPWVYPHLGNPVFGNTLWEKTTPVAAMDFIQQQGLTGNIFHPQIYGDYLIWRLWPQQRSFIDGRVHLFDDAVIQNYRLVFRDSHWADHLAQYDIKYLLLSKGEEDNRMMMDAARGSAGWRVLYEDEQSVLFERADPSSPVH
jgi:hypothetical protein